MSKQTITTVVLVLAASLFGCKETTAAGAGPGPQTANVVVCAPGSFMNGNECIPIKPECPAGTTARDGQCFAVPQVAVEEPESAPVTTADANGKGYEEILDPRRQVREPRARALLVTEVQGLEALFAAVPKDASDRPHLIRRLGEAYVELAAAAARDSRAAKDAETVAKSERLEAAARSAAIKYYAMLVMQYPKFCRSAQATGKSSGCNDETLYYLGVEYVRSKELDKARKTFLQVIRDWPQSDFAGHTYFQFGEMFRREAAMDPTKWALAEQSFAEATKYEGKIRSPAYERLADVYQAQGKTAEAKAARGKAQGAAVATP